MVRSYLLDNSDDSDFQISVIEEAMSNFHRYFFIMPTLARFELEIHEREERGGGVSAEDMIALMADLFAEKYGEEMMFDRQRVGITWATFGHLYADYVPVCNRHFWRQRFTPYLSGVPYAVMTTWDP
jgi:oligoendopeptidase F